MSSYVTSHGYRVLYMPGHPLANSKRSVYEHRLVLHSAGIDVPDGHEVHHINGDKLDNRLENLQVVTPQEHHELHSGSVVTDAELRQLILLGYSYLELAAHGIWQQKVRKVRYELGIRRRHPQRTRTGRLIAIWSELTANRRAGCGTTSLPAAVGMPEGATTAPAAAELPLDEYAPANVDAA